MNTQHFKYVLEVERTGSITQAAENLYIGQPSLSKAIKELEESLGITIFNRTSKGAVPTQKGMEFLKYARAVMVQIEKMEALYRPGHPDRQELSVSIARSGYASLAAAEFAAELNAEKEMDVSVIEADSVCVLENVVNDKAGLGLIRYRPEDEAFFVNYLRMHELRWEQIWEFDLRVIFSKKHPLADRTPLKADSLFPYIEVVLVDETVPYVTFEEAERPDLREDKHVHVKDRLNQLEMVSRINGAYIWSEPLPEEILSRYSLVQRRCASVEFCRRDALVCHKDHEFSAAEKRFINKVYECRNRLAFK
ncbi:MAG: LysR family transcriptional regulator [Clostridia bacterium]|nr:LysR family transcriptional regulator [Clostridia bacterium]